jgi:hypothetical protein
MPEQRYVIINRHTGQQLVWQNPDTRRDEPLTFPSPHTAALFIIDQDLNPSKLYWRKEDE